MAQNAPIAGIGLKPAYQDTSRARNVLMSNARYAPTLGKHKVTWLLAQRLHAGKGKLFAERLAFY